MIEPATFNTPRQFRARVYDRFGARRDALFELLDAATVAGLVPSLAYLSLPPVHRRGWGSLYAALAAGSLQTAALRELMAGYPLDDGQPIYALDTSVWPRDDAETSPERGHSFSSSRQSICDRAAGRAQGALAGRLGPGSARGRAVPRGFAEPVGLITRRERSGSGWRRRR